MQGKNKGQSVQAHT